MTKHRRIIVQIEPHEDCCRGSIGCDAIGYGCDLEDIRLEADRPVAIKGNTFPLADLVVALIDHDEDYMRLAFDHRGQLELGRLLFDETLGKAGPELLDLLLDDGIVKEVRINSPDEFVGRLPWVLLACREGRFLSALNCGIDMSHGESPVPTEMEAFPATPKFLAAAPRVAGRDETDGDNHIRDLRNMLEAVDARYATDALFRRVETFRDFSDELGSFKPHVIYFYGHGTGDGDASGMLFGDHDIPAANLADVVRKLPLRDRPLLAYVNCCRGDSGGVLGAGHQLSDLIPAVVSNNTLAVVEAARAQAEVFFRDVVVERRPPHEAMGNLRTGLADVGLTYRDARWMTPTLHCTYDAWRAGRPRKKIDRTLHDPFWHLKLDRVDQFGRVFLHCSDMLEEQTPKSIAFIWFGKEGQGVDLFHKRLRYELGAKLKSEFCPAVPDWPVELSEPDLSFDHMVAKALDIQDLDWLPQCAQCHIQGRTHARLLIYMEHVPLRSLGVMSLPRLKEYLTWWSENVVPRLPDHVFGLVGISLIVKSPEKARKSLAKHFTGFWPNGVAVTVLDELSKIDETHVIDFLRRHKIYMKEKVRDALVRRIVRETGGNYEMVVERLKYYIDRNFDLDVVAGQEAAPDQDDDEDDLGVDD